MSSAGTACEINPNFTSGIIGATTTMWAQQQRHPSPEDPWSESFVVGFEKRQVGGETKSQPKISVAARSRTKTVTTRRAVEQSAIWICLIIPPYLIHCTRIAGTVAWTSGRSELLATAASVLADSLESRLALGGKPRGFQYTRTKPFRRSA